MTKALVQLFAWTPREAHPRLRQVLNGKLTSLFAEAKIRWR